jgi:thermitase
MQHNVHRKHPDHQTISVGAVTDEARRETLPVETSSTAAAEQSASGRRRALALSLSLAGLASAALWLGSPASALAQVGGAEPGAIVPGRVLALPRAGVAEGALHKAVRDQGGQDVRRIGNSNLRIIDVPLGAERGVQQRLARSPLFKFAELDRVVPLDGSANDPMAGSQWHLAKIRSDTAWDKSQGTGVTIAILDTGVDGNHPDLADRLVPGWNFWDNNSDTRDVHGHGTKVAGAAAATLNNALGIAGVAGQARLMPIRIGSATGGLSYSAAAQGLTYAADRGVRVANISASSVADSSAVVSAAQYMKDKGGLVFVSAGNTGGASTTKESPAIILVSATDSNDALAGFSTYGAAVKLSSPGVSIYTTTAGGGYGGVNGTSFSAPVAAGVAALVMSANGNLTSADIERLLLSTALDLGTAGRDVYFGHGRVDAAAAVAAAATSTSTADTQPPTVAIASPVGGSTVSGAVKVDVSANDNVGVARVALLLNGSTIATDSSAPFGFSWDSTGVVNGSATLTAVAYDAAGNSASSNPVTVTVMNGQLVDTTPPTAAFTSPGNGVKVNGSVKVSVALTDNAGAAGIKSKLYIGGKLVASATGSGLSYTWNTRKVSAGSYTLSVTATDAAGNQSSTSIGVIR